MEVKLNVEIKTARGATCPDGRGLREYSCLVGHRYSARGLLQAHSEAQEKACGAAVVALEEAANLVREVAGDFPLEIAAPLQEQAARKVEQAAAIRGIVQELESSETGT